MLKVFVAPKLTLRFGNWVWGELCSSSTFFYQQRRNASSKHWLLKWRRLRRMKYIPVEKPDFLEIKKESNLSPDEMRIKLKKDGMLPPRGFEERPINISSTGDVFDGYIPPEGDGRSSLISKKGGQQTYDAAQSKRKSFMALRKMKKLEEGFNANEFATEAQEMYIEAQTLLNQWKDNEDRLHEIVSENALPLMVHGLDRKTFRWKFIETIEPARVTHVRTLDMLSKDNIYAQVTVRMHTKQTLAIYDQFGRLMYGSENIVKDVLEYIVFEKHISDTYGRWRIHGKIIPTWMPARDPIIRTYRQVNRLINTDEIIDDSSSDSQIDATDETLNKVAAA